MPAITSGDTLSGTWTGRLTLICASMIRPHLNRRLRKSNPFTTKGGKLHAEAARICFEPTTLPRSNSLLASNKVINQRTEEVQKQDHQHPHDLLGALQPSILYAID